MNPYPREGQNWAHFEIRSEIARGNMGVVYRAVDTRTKREVALKILVGGHDNPDAVERFKREAKSLARCNHPNIVNVHTYGVTQGLPFLTMDYVPGTTLQELLDRGALPLPRAVDLLGRMALGLDHVHSRGVLHRDVKPANVLIGADGTPRITDFGLAKLSDASISLTQDGDIIGTPIFMSPEQIQGQQKLVGPATDVWALGVILYQMLTNELPFRGRTVDQVSQAVVQMEPTPPRELQAGVPEDLERICLAALAKDPRQRYGSGGELARDLEAYLRGGRVLAGQVTPMVRARRAARFVKLHAGPVGALVVSVLLLCSVLGLHLFFEARARATLAAEQDEKAQRLEGLVETALERCREALAERRPAQALEAAEEALRKVEQAEHEQPEHHAALSAAAARARIALGVPPEEAAAAARSFAGAFLASKKLADGEACVDYYWHTARPDLGPLRKAPLQHLSTYEDPAWLRLVVRLHLLFGEERPWRVLLDRAGPLRDRARQLEAAWLLDHERTFEAFNQLEQIPFEQAPLLHARYLRAVQSLQLSARGPKLAAPLAGAKSWQDAHARLTALAQERGLEGRIRAAAAEAEVALIHGESERAKAILAAARTRELPPELEAELEVPLLIARALRDQGSALDEGLARDLVARLPRIDPAARTRLARLTRALGLSEVAYPLPLARDAEQVDRLSGQLFTVIGAIALHRLGSGPQVLTDASLAQSGCLREPFVEKQAKRGVHPLFNSAASLHVTLTRLDMAAAEQDQLRELWFDRDSWLRHPTHSLARRMIHAGVPLEPSDMLARPAPLGLQEGRLLLARVHGKAWKDPFHQARRALDLAVRRMPADLDTRLARAELYLRRAACVDPSDERALHLDRALSEAAAAVACSSGSPAARSLFLQTLWVANTSEFARLHRPEPEGHAARFDEWLTNEASCLGAADVLLLRALRSQQPSEALLDAGATPAQRAQLAIARRRLAFLQRARGVEAAGSAAELGEELEEHRVAAAEAEQLWILGERLLAEPTLALSRLLEGTRLSEDELQRAQVEAGLASPPNAPTTAGRPGRHAAAARALLLLDHLGHQEAPTHMGWLTGWQLLQELWRERPGRPCNALQVLLTLWTRVPSPALARELVHLAKDVPDTFLEQVAGLEGGARPKFATARRIAAWVEFFGRQEEQ